MVFCCSSHGRYAENWWLCGKNQADVYRWIFLVVAGERDYPSYPWWRRTAPISVEGADVTVKGAVQVSCTCIAGLLPLTLPLVACFLCSAGIAVGFYGNGETSDGIHRLTYSLRHANRTVAGVQDRVSAGGDMRANGECGNGQTCSAPLLLNLAVPVCRPLFLVVFGL